MTAGLAPSYDALRVAPGGATLCGVVGLENARPASAAPWLAGLAVSKAGDARRLALGPSLPVRRA